MKKEEGRGGGGGQRILDICAGMEKVGWRKRNEADKDKKNRKDKAQRKERKQ